MNKTSKGKRQKVKKSHPWHRPHDLSLRKPFKARDFNSVKIFTSL